MANIDKCEGLEDYAKCNTCYRLTSKSIGFEQEYLTPNLTVNGCSDYIDNASWQDPQRDKAIAQNGNVGYSDSDVLS